MVRLTFLSASTSPVPESKVLLTFFSSINYLSPSLLQLTGEKLLSAVYLFIYYIIYYLPETASRVVWVPPYRPMGSTWIAATETMWVPC